MCIHKSCHCADELKFSAVELLHAIVGKVFDDRVFSRHDFCEIKPHTIGANSPRLGMTHEMHHFRSVQKRLRWHATAQDAESANFFTALNDYSFETCVRRRARGGVTTTATTYDCYIEIVFHR